MYLIELFQVDSDGKMQEEQRPPLGHCPDLPPQCSHNFGRRSLDVCGPGIEHIKQPNLTLSTTNHPNLD